MNSVFILLVWIIPLARTQRERCVWKIFPNITGVYGPDSYLTTQEQVASEYLCQALCIKTPGCVSVDWRPVFNNCTLYRIPPKTQSEDGCVHGVYDCVILPCTPLGRWCVEKATCVNRTCVCPADHPKGVATIDCVGEDKHLCMVHSDPKTLTWGGAIVPINLPCWYRLTDFFVFNSNLSYNYNKCRVQVHALNQLTFKGLFFVRRVLIKLWLGRLKMDGQYSWGLHTSYTIDIDHDVVWQAMSSYDTEFDKKPRQYLLDLAIHRQFDRDGRYAIVSFVQCGVRIKFRPFDPDHQPQNYRPGVTVSVPQHAEFPDGKTWNTVCLSPEEGPTVYEDMAYTHGLTSGSELLLHNILLMGTGLQKIKIPHEYKDHCMEVVQSFSDVLCEAHRAFTIKLCAPLLNYRSFLRCFLNNDINPMKVFEACIKWGCNGSKAYCSVFKGHLLHCQSTHFMRRTGCNLNKRLKISEMLYQSATYVDKTT